MRPSLSVLEKVYGRSFGPATTLDSISKTMREAGNGATGIVYGSRGKGQVGHVFNVVNQNGRIRYLDGQTGRRATTSDYRSFNLIRTNKK
jgi:filamentous hemagglutinin